MQTPFILITVVLVLWQLESPCLVAGEVYLKNDVPHVKLAHGGIISGSVKLSRDERPYNEFIGIPYATVPERFQEPQPVTKPSWDGVFDATKPGSKCPQVPLLMIGNDFGNEDCLKINVYLPVNKTGSETKGYPVMVWVHGGGFTSGSGVDNGPQFFMDEDVIVVSFNYRVGVFGFLSTGDSVVPGNNGLKDMVVALKWVRDNIGRFGGDNSRVTIFGVSAGGAAVHHLLLSPTTTGLFHRAISQSGSALNQWAFNPNLKQNAVGLATHLNCPTAASVPSGITSQEILTCLKGISMDELTKAQIAFKPNWLPLRTFPFAPTVEPSDVVSGLTPFHSETPASILARKDKELKEIPWMVGATEDEGALFAGFILSNPDSLKEMNSDWVHVASSAFDYGTYLSNNLEQQTEFSQKLKQFYFGDQDISEETRVSLRNLYSDEMFLSGIYKAALETASRGKQNPVYLYQYTYKGPLALSLAAILQVKGEESEKVSHGDDLIHMFDNDGMFPGFGASGIVKKDTPDEEFSKHFVRLWTSFAIHGEPRHSWGDARSKKWKPISKNELDGVEPQRWYRIEANPSFAEVGQAVKDRMQFWDTLWGEYLTPLLTDKNKLPKPVKTEL